MFLTETLCLHHSIVATIAKTSCLFLVDEDMSFVLFKVDMMYMAVNQPHYSMMDAAYVALNKFEKLVTLFTVLVVFFNLNSLRLTCKVWAAMKSIAISKIRNNFLCILIDYTIESKIRRFIKNYINGQSNCKGKLYKTPTTL